METGNSFERVKKAIHFGYPDRIPIMHAILPGAWLKYGDSLYEIVKKFPGDLADKNSKPSLKRSSASGYSMSTNLTKKYIYEDDFSFIEARNFMYGLNEASGRQQDEWDCIWEKIDPGIVGQVVSHPLADWDKWKNYRFPDTFAYWRWDNENFLNIIKESRCMGKYIIGYGGNVFEKMQWLRGYEELMIDICLNQERVKALGEKICEYVIGTVQKLAGFGVDGIEISDDWGTQKDLMISPDLWRKLFKPYYKNIFNEIHKFGTEIHFHTDGNTISIIDDLIEIGADVINPQFSAMNLDELSKKVKSKVCIRTDIDRQYILIKSTPKEMDEYIKKIFELMGSEKGGIMFKGEINSDCPLELIEAMYVAFEKHGRYYWS